MKPIALTLIVTLALVSCTKPTDGFQDPDKPSDNMSSVTQIISGDSLLKLLYDVTQTDSLTKTFDFKLAEFPKIWIALSNSEFGPVIYNRGTVVSQLVIQDDSIVNVGDELIKSKLSGFKKLGPRHYKLASEEGSMSYTFEILDEITMVTLVHWEVFSGNNLVGGRNSIYIPKAKEHHFKHVDEPPRDSPGSSLPISELNIDSVKATYRRK